METVTLSTLRIRTRFYADEETAGLFTDTASSIDVPINEALKTVRGWVLGESGGETFWKVGESFALKVGTSEYKLDGSDKTNGTDYCADMLGEVVLEWSATEHQVVTPVSEADWIALSVQTWSQAIAKGYILRASYNGTSYAQVLALAPTPTGVVTASLSYIPALSEMTTTTASLVGPTGFGTAVAMAAAKILTGRQGLRTEYLKELEQAAYKSMRTEIIKRTHHYGKRIVDVSPDDVVWDEHRLLPPA